MSGVDLAAIKQVDLAQIVRIAARFHHLATSLARRWLIAIDSVFFEEGTIE